MAIYETKDNGNTFIIKGINKAGGEKSKVKLEEIKDKSVVEIFPSVKEIGLFDIFKKVYATGKPEYLPTGFYKDNRMSQWVENYVYKLSSGEIVAIYEDISERKLPKDFPTTYSFEYPKISNQALLTLIIWPDSFNDWSGNGDFSKNISSICKSISSYSVSPFLTLLIIADNIIN